MRRTASGANIGNGIRQGANFVATPVYPLEIVGNWTWIQGSVSGNATQMNGISAGTYWVSTSQLGPGANPQGVNNNGTGRTCNVSSGSVVRHTPGGTNHGVTGGSGVTFQFSAYGTRNAGGWTWRLGAIRGTAAATNGWRNRLVWIATSQLTNCR